MTEGVYQGRSQAVWMREVLILAVMVIAAGLWWTQALTGVLGGVVIYWLNALAFDWTSQKAHIIARENPKKSMGFLYVAALVRFVLVAVLFIVAITQLDLPVAAMVLSFMVMQLQQIIDLAGKKRLTD